MGTYDKPLHEICVDKSSCRHELTAEGKPVKREGKGQAAGGQSARPAEKNMVAETYQQGQGHSGAGRPRGES